MTEPAPNQSGKIFPEEKRRFVRYVSPKIYVRFGCDGTFYPAADYSLSGLLVDGVPPGALEGDRISITVKLKTIDDDAPFTGTATIARLLREKKAAGINFPSSAEGPIMAFVRQRRIDLGRAEMARA
jgi:hypothetical protein